MDEPRQPRTTDVVLLDLDAKPGPPPQRVGWVLTTVVVCLAMVALAGLLVPLSMYG